MYTSRNYVEKVTLDVGGSTESVFTSWMCKYQFKRHLQKMELQLNEFTRQNNMSDDFELGEHEMEPTSSVTFSTSLREVRVAEQSKASIWVYKAYMFLLFF